jgi:hypothetical protein
VKSRRSLILLAVTALLAFSPALARAYESSSTHPGITGQALLHSARLHAFLRQDLGLALGLFARLTLPPREWSGASCASFTAASPASTPAGAV